jgi:hypothetical protein
MLRAYENEYCRVRTYLYEMDTEVKGLKTVRFKPRKEHGTSPLRNPENACYCPYDDLNKCNVNGIEMLAPCLEGKLINMNIYHSTHYLAMK